MVRRTSGQKVVDYAFYDQVRGLCDTSLTLHSVLSLLNESSFSKQSNQAKYLVLDVSIEVCYNPISHLQTPSWSPALVLAGPVIA